MLPDATDERAKIIAWLRSLDRDEWYPSDVADALERGEHDYIDLPRLKLGKVGD